MDPSEFTITFRSDVVSLLEPGVGEGVPLEFDRAGSPLDEAPSIISAECVRAGGNLEFLLLTANLDADVPLNELERDSATGWEPRAALKELVRVFAALISVSFDSPVALAGSTGPFVPDEVDGVARASTDFDRKAGGT